VTGALLLTRAHLNVDEAVGLKLYLSESSRQPRVAAARVVRVEERSPDRAEVWPFSVAVEFDEPLTDCALEIRDLAARQEAIGLPKD